MFRLFPDNSEVECPIDLQTRLWMEQAFVWLVGEFGNDNLRSKAMLLPTSAYFPFHFNGSIEALNATATIVAKQMEINIEEVDLHVYKDGISEITTEFGSGIFMLNDADGEEQPTGGLYWGKNEAGKYDIMVEEKGLAEAEILVAVLSHEFSHIKLQGEARTEENDEMLADLTTVVFGLGIFNANVSFRALNFAGRFMSDNLGYLKQREWGYALALFAHFREERQPEWTKYLNINLQSDFRKSEAYILANTDKIFNEEYKPPQI